MTSHPDDAHKFPDSRRDDPTADAIPDDIPDDAVDEVELAISRVIDGEESPEQWESFAATADGEPRMWRELAWRQREAAQLARAVARRIDHAGAALPIHVSVGAMSDRAGDRGAVQIDSGVSDRAATGVRGDWARSLGWSAAALVALAWIISSAIRPSTAPPIAVQSAALVAPDAGADAYLDAYMDLGQREGFVVGELPTKLLIESRELGVGEGFEVLFVRPIVERRIVPVMYGFSGVDEQGAPRVVPVGDDGSM